MFQMGKMYLLRSPAECSTFSPFRGQGPCIRTSQSLEGEHRMQGPCRTCPEHPKLIKTHRPCLMHNYTALHCKMALVNAWNQVDTTDEPPRKLGEIRAAFSVRKAENTPASATKLCANIHTVTMWEPDFQQLARPGGKGRSYEPRSPNWRIGAKCVNIRKQVE